MVSALLLLVAALHTASGQSCGSCKFPFTFAGRIHTTCTTIDGDSRPWCSTRVDSSGQHVSGGGHYEYCSSSCPGVSLPAIAIDPRNQPGDSCVCGVTNSQTRQRIVGGQETDVGEFPWQVALLFGSTLLSQGCAGTLVSDRHVVTAAHCTAGQTAANLRVAIGETTFAVSTEAESSIQRVAKITDHPNYNGNTQANDISVLELSSPLDLTSMAHIKPACLPARGATFSGATATVAGWGTVSSGGDSVVWLNKVSVRVDSGCSGVSGTTADMICAGVTGGGKDACQGDSGGPLITRDSASGGAQALIGVVSWGRGCARADNPGVYSEVAHNRQWLDSVLAGSTTCPIPDGSAPPTTTTTAPTTTTTAPATTNSAPATFPQVTSAPMSNTTTAETTATAGTTTTETETETATEPETTTTTTTTTTTAGSTECFEENKIPTFQYKRVSGRVSDPAACQARCQQMPDDCDYFRWKKSRKSGYCYFVKVIYRTRTGWTSGPKNC